MLLLPIGDKNKTLAAAFMQEYRNKGYGQNVLNVSDEKFYKFIYYGKLGELVFRDFLLKENIQFSCEDILKPYPGRFKREGSDFLLTRTEETIDVKTIEESYKTRLLVREDQFSARQHDLYVGQRTTNDVNMECWGYVTGKELSKISTSTQFGHGPCRHWLLRNLHPIEELVRRVRNGERISEEPSRE